MQFSDKFFEVPTSQIDDNEKSCGRFCLDKMLIGSRLNMKRLVDKHNTMFPDDTTSVNNLVNKLRRGSLRDFELSAFAKAAGYNLLLVRDDSIDDMVQPLQSDTDSTNLSIDLSDLAFATYMKDGYSTASTTNFPYIFIVGKAAAKVKKILEENVKLTNSTKTDEMFLIVKLEYKYNVRIKLVQPPEIPSE